MPISMGRKGAPIDWSAFDKRAMRALGAVPRRGQRLGRDDLMALGFVEAAKALPALLPA